MTLPKSPEFVEGMTGYLAFDDTGERTNYTLQIVSLYADGLKTVSECLKEDMNIKILIVLHFLE